MDTVVGGACIFGVKDGETEKMTDEQVDEQAAIAWYILAQYAQNKKGLTYGELAKLMNSQYKSRLRAYSGASRHPIPIHSAT